MLPHSLKQILVMALNNVLWLTHCRSQAVRFHFPPPDDFKLVSLSSFLFLPLKAITQNISWCVPYSPAPLCSSFSIYLRQTGRLLKNKSAWLPAFWNSRDAESSHEVSELKMQNHACYWVQIVSWAPYCAGTFLNCPDVYRFNMSLSVWAFIRCLRVFSLWLFWCIHRLLKFLELFPYGTIYGGGRVGNASAHVSSLCAAIPCDERKAWQEQCISLSHKLCWFKGRPKGITLLGLSCYCHFAWKD